MNFVQLHLLLNHFPIIGTMVGLGLLLISLSGKNDDLRRASLIIFLAMALLSIPTFFSGPGAEGAIKKLPGISDDLIERHHGAAMLALLFMEFTGALALTALWKSRGISRPARWNGIMSAVLLFSIVTVGLMARVGNTGGDIRHPEIASQKQGVTEELMISKIIYTFEPSPDKFAELMTASKWWWAFMMDLHFVGLVMLIGTVGILDLRVLGFAKQIPIDPLHRLLPFAMAGFALNLVTGVLAFTGMDKYYTYDWAFWFKMLAILLLGVNVAAFYLTSAFDSVEHMGPGDDAPPLAKFIAATSLFLWFAVITLGRYIQSFSDTISVHK
ncbi:MAG TPA: DUF6644 family protein [Candidatus Acidoferrum sp.]|jgi:hypothetical protein|nr:DUF6644 family protein [Candidatus Acidoferrum sp.]